MGGQAQGGGGRRRQERKGNQTGRRVMARGAEAGAQAERSQNSGLRENLLGRGKGWRVCWVPRPGLQAPMWTMG